MYDFDEMYTIDGMPIRSFNDPDEHGIYPRSAEHLLKMNAPYSYKPFYVFRCSDKKVTASVYSDRLQGWNSAAYKAAAQAVFETDYPNFRKDPNLIEKFMRLYSDEPELVLVDVIEYCNVSNGYPCWRIDYHVPK